MKGNQKGVALAITAATLLASGFMAPVAQAKTQVVRCQLSTGGESEGNSCAGANGCPSKSTTVEEMTREECKKAGGKIVK